MDKWEWALGKIFSTDLQTFIRARNPDALGSPACLTVSIVLTLCPFPSASGQHYLSLLSRSTGSEILSSKNANFSSTCKFPQIFNGVGGRGDGEKHPSKSCVHGAGERQLPWDKQVSSPLILFIEHLLCTRRCISLCGCCGEYDRLLFSEQCHFEIFGHILHENKFKSLNPLSESVSLENRVTFIPIISFQDTFPSPPCIIGFIYPISESWVLPTIIAYIP